MKYIFKVSLLFLISLATRSMPIPTHYTCPLELTDRNKDKKYTFQTICNRRFSVEQGPIEHEMFLDFTLHKF